MPTRAEIEDALRNAHAAGDRAAATRLADALVSMRPAAAPPERIDPSEGMGRGEKLLVGAGAALARAGEGIGRLYAATGLPGSDDFAPALEQAKANREAYQQNHPGGWATAGEVLGDVAMSAVPVGAAARVGAQVGTRVLPRAMAKFAPAAADIAANAAYGAATAPEERGQAAAFGAGGAALARGAQRVAGGVVKPWVTDDARALMRQGVQPTVGQSLGGWANTMEQQATSIPLVGEAVRHARNRAIGEWNEALVGKVAQSAEGAPVGIVGELPRKAAERVGGSGDEALLALRENIGGVYERVLAQAPEIRLDRARIASAAQQIADDPALAMSDATRQRFAAYVQKNLTGRADPLTGQAAKRIESDLGRAASTYGSSAIGEERAFGEALQRLHALWRESLEGSLPPHLQEQLIGANAAWRGMLPLDRAAATAGSQANGGRFSPKVLRQALANLDKTQHDNALRRAMQAPVEMAERGMPYDYIAAMARAGKGLGDTVPDSGTAGRLGLGVLGLGAAHAAGVSAPALMAGAAAGAGSTRVGQRMLTQGVPLAQPVAERLLAGLQRIGVSEEAAKRMLPLLLATQARQEQPEPVAP